MKLLLFSDLHCNVSATENIIAQSRTVDVVIGAGDFGNARHGIEICIDLLKQIECPAVLVPGNSESVEELQRACSTWKSAHVLHGSGVNILGVDFYGIGGGIPVTPFGSWSYDFTEAQAAKLLSKCPTGGVLVSHSPPLGTLDVSSSGKNLGSTAVLNAITRNRPQLVACGHIHASGGQRAMIGKTIVINAGSAGVTFEGKF